MYCETLKYTTSNSFSLKQTRQKVCGFIYARVYITIIIMSPLSSETQALLKTNNGDEQKRTKSSSFTSPLKAATAIVAVSTSLFATASYSVSGTRGSSSSRLGDLQREGGVDLFKRAVANEQQRHQHSPEELAKDDASFLASSDDDDRTTSSSSSLLLIFLVVVVLKKALFFV